MINISLIRCQIASLCWRCAEGHSQKKFPRAKIVITTCPCAANTTCKICMQNVPQAQQNLGSARESYSPLLWNCIFFYLLIVVPTLSFFNVLRDSCHFITCCASYKPNPNPHLNFLDSNLRNPGHHQWTQPSPFHAHRLCFSRLFCGE